MWHGEAEQGQSGQAKGSAIACLAKDAGPSTVALSLQVDRNEIQQKSPPVIERTQKNLRDRENRFS